MTGKWLDKLLGYIIVGAIGWATWVTVQLHAIEVALSPLQEMRGKIERLELAVWPHEPWRR